jgi:putative transposase
MPSCVKTVSLPRSQQYLPAGASEVDHGYVTHIDFREGLRSHLWQERVASFPAAHNNLLMATYLVMEAKI